MHTEHHLKASQIFYFCFYTAPTDSPPCTTWKCGNDSDPLREGWRSQVLSLVMTSSFTLLEKRWWAQYPCGIYAFTKTLLFTWPCTIAGPLHTQRQKPQLDRLSADPHAALSWLRLQCKPAYKWLRTQFAASRGERVGGRKFADQQTDENVMRIRFVQDFFAHPLICRC